MSYRPPLPQTIADEARGWAKDQKVKNALTELDGDTRLRIRATADDLDRLDALVEREGAGSRSALVRRLVAECEAQPASSSASVDLACPACGARVTARLRVQEVG